MLIEQSIDTGEVVLNVAEGETVGPPLVLLPGITLQWQSFLPLIPALIQDWHVYACDLRGQGKSGRAERYHMNDYVRDFAVSTKHFQNESAVLVGHSLGGMIALCAAAQMPQRVRVLVLLDPAFIIGTGKATDNPAYPWCRWVHDTLTAASSFDDIVISVRTKWPNADESFVMNRADLVSHVDPEVLSTWFHDRIMAGIDLTQVLRRVTCPTLIFRAGLVHDSPLRDTDIALIRQHLVDAKIVEMPNASHNLHQEQPEFILDHMRKFQVMDRPNSR